MINHLFPHLKRLSLSESLNAVLQKETFAPRILVDILHYLIRSDAMVDNQLLEQANKAEEIANHLATLLEENASLESQDSEKLLRNFNKTSPDLQAGVPPLGDKFFRNSQTGFTLIELWNCFT